MVYRFVDKDKKELIGLSFEEGVKILLTQKKDFKVCLAKAWRNGKPNGELRIIQESQKGKICFLTVTDEKFMTLY